MKKNVRANIPRGAIGVTPAAPSSDGRVARPARPHAPWPRVKLGEVCEEKIARIKTLPANAEIAYIDIASIDRDKKAVVSTTHYLLEAAPGRAQQLVRKGDLLISTVRPNLNAVALVEDDGDSPLVASTGFCVIRVKPKLEAKFAYYYGARPNLVETRRPGLTPRLRPGGARGRPGTPPRFH